MGIITDRQYIHEQPPQECDTYAVAEAVARKKRRSLWAGPAPRPLGIPCSPAP